MTSLFDFAEKVTPACPVCGIPEQAEIELAWVRGTRAATIQRWLVEIKGYEDESRLSRGIRNHFESRHSHAAS